MLLKGLHGLEQENLKLELSRTRTVGAESKIYIIGMPGSGKSTIGKLLADKLKLLFYDLDFEIEQSKKKSIAEIFDEVGEEEFRVIENAIFQERNAGQSAFVMSTGGGTPCFFESINKMNKWGTTVYLKAPLEILKSRTEKNTNRPLLKDDYSSSLKKLYSSRKSCYEQASYTINIANKAKEGIVLEIMRLLDL